MAKWQDGKRAKGLPWERKGGKDKMKKIQVPTELGTKAFGVLLTHGIVRSVLPVEPPTFIVFDEQIEKLRAADIPFTVIPPKGGEACAR